MWGRIANQREFAAGALFVVIGSTWAILSLGYPLGRLTRMGPGYFPLCAAILLAVVGAGSMARSLRSPEQARIGRFPWRSFLFVVAGVVGFGLLIRTAGLIAASAFVVAMACHGRWREKPLEVVALCVLFTVAVSAIFVYGLGLPIKLY